MILTIKGNNLYSEDRLAGVIEGSKITLKHDEIKDLFMRQSRLHFKRPEKPRTTQEMFDVVAFAMKERREKTTSEHEKQIHNLNRIIFCLEEDLGRKNVEFNDLWKKYVEQAKTIS